jgi:hypothetical protein
MKRPRVSIATLCVVVGLVAVNLAWVRFILTSRESLLGFDLSQENGCCLDLGVMAMLDALILGPFGFKRGPFLVGFALGGVAATLAFIFMCQAWPEWFGEKVVMEWVIHPIHESYKTLVHGLNDYKLLKPVLHLPLLASYAITLSAPLLLIACLCGLAARLVGPKVSR